MRLHLSLDLAFAEAFGKCVLNDFVRVLELRRVTRFNFRLHGCTTAKRFGCKRGARSATAIRNRLDDRVTLKPGGMKIRNDLVNLVITERRPRHKLGRVAREQLTESLLHCLCELVLRKPIPDTEHKPPAGLENPPRFRVRLNSIREEHHRELTRNRIEVSISMPELACVCL